MRFSIPVAFMLPLSALAAPSLVKRALAADNVTHTNLDSALQATNEALDQIINFPIPEPLQNQKLNQTVTLAKGKITKAIAHEKEIALKFAAGQEVKEEDEGAVKQSLLDGHGIIVQLEIDFKNGTNGFDMSNLSQAQHDSLAKFLHTAADKVSNARKFVLNILGLATS